MKADGSTGSLSDIKVGSLVRVTTGSSPEQAGEIKLVERKKKEGAQKGGE